MDSQAVKRLLALNREFYGKFASEFSETRTSKRMELERITPFLRDDMRVLDAGCGNGRLAEWLEGKGFRLTYVGIDSVPEVIEIARKRQSNLRNVSTELQLADVTKSGWTTVLHSFGPFDAAFALGTLHHIPGIELRTRVLGDIRSLVRPGGVLILSNWQFMADERTRRKIVPWEKVGLEASDLEEGDALIDWKRGGTGYRYVHQFSAAEVQSLSESSGFQVLEQFKADAERNLFSILRRLG